ncbi:hypothetical protein C7H85_07810 [Zobellella endophytica]|uniref:Uncharacterized protein n=1 Tax=Zobellella endophytica TaxID=2116700 RepID=A0A2P7R8F3_9GAMM|nr:hypothetical protein [Zobellella endophytica]PSJ46526.1 hypothetical protein C7H85_07810 [Zobellella endophytica]
MESFYVSYTLGCTDADAVAAVLEGRNAFVTSAHKGSVVVFDEEAEGQQPEVVLALGCLLSAELKAPVLVAQNHDDDILLCALCQQGWVVDQYNSAPELFEPDPDAEPIGPQGGNAGRLAEAFASPHADEIERILRRPSGDAGYLFAYERHFELVKALGISEFGVNTGYKYLAAGEIPAGLELGQLRRLRAGE